MRGQNRRERDVPAESARNPAAVGAAAPACWPGPCCFLVPVALGLGVAWPWLERMAVLRRGHRPRPRPACPLPALVATLPSLRAELEAVNNNQDFKAFYFDAQTPALAGATLQQKVQDIVKAAGSRLVSTQILPTTLASSRLTVRVRIQLQGPRSSCSRSSTSSSSPGPFCLSIRSRCAPWFSRSARSQPDERNRQVRRPPSRPETEDLTVRLDIFGYALGGA